MRLGIVGSRHYNNYDEFKSVIETILGKWNYQIKDIEMIIAREYPLARFLANENLIPISSSLETDIVLSSTHMIAFPSIKGSETQDTIKKIIQTNKLFEVYWIDRKFD